MKIKQLFLAAALLLVNAVSVMAQEMQMPPIPVDKNVRIGKLGNGLTYYIRNNGYPEHRVNFYIAQRVGSIQENEDQRGLAHFLEHMAFNGSDNYPDNRLIEYLRSIGVEFGSDLNAYTAVDQTVYRVCNVPSARTNTLDSCLLILKDWSNGLTLDAKEIDKERGVIHEEWRMRTSAMMRMLERNLENLYPGSKYGRRMPIGLMEVVDNFKPKVLRDYYKKWYRPDNQAIIVVGDVDVDRTEAKIKELFSGIKLMKNPAPVVDEQVPDNEQAIVIIDKDKEQQNDLIELFFKHDPVPDAEKVNMDYMLNSYANQMVSMMMNSRFQELTQNPDCPFVMAVCYDDDFIFAKTKRAFTLYMMPKDGKSTEAAATVMREVLRAKQFGFTATEFARAKDEYMSQLEKIYTNRNKRENDVYGDLYRDHFLGNEPIPAIEDEYMIMQQFAPMIPVEAINMHFKEMFNTDSEKNFAMMAFYNEKEGRTYPTKEGFLSAINAVRAEQLTAWVDNVKQEPLMPNMPEKGKIVAEKENKELGYKELTLSNGARVLLKKTDFKDDEIMMQAYSKGGSSLLSEADNANIKMFDAVIASSGLGAFSNTELQKALAGKQVSVNLSLNKLHEYVSGGSTPKDLETLLQLTYLHFTDIRKDEKSFANLMEQMKLALKNKAISPDAAFSDSVQVTLHAHSPRYESLDIKDLDKVNYDRILEIAKERTANAGDFTFTFVGNFDEETIRPLIEQYIASLPDNGTRENWKPVSAYAKGDVENKFYRKMETPKANTYMFWYNNKAPYTLENSIYADVAGQVLDMIYLKEIREDAGAAYSASAFGYSSLGGDVPYTVIIGVCPFKPEKADLALGIMQDAVKQVAEKVDADKLNKIKELLLKRADDNAKKNDYWMGAITAYDEYKVNTVTDYKKIVNAMTPEKISNFVKNVILAGGNNVRVIMMPDTQN